MDARNIGIWRKCITTTVPDMPEGWLDRAGVVLTSQTGVEVSNNHDVMSLEVCWLFFVSFERRALKRGLGRFFVRRFCFLVSGFEQHEVWSSVLRASFRCFLSFGPHSQMWCSMFLCSVSGWFIGFLDGMQKLCGRAFCAEFFRCA